IPAAVIALVYLLVFASSAAHSKRYRTGRPYHQSAVWYVANKSEGAELRGASGHEVGAGSAPHALYGDTGAGSATSASAIGGAPAGDQAPGTADREDDGTGLTTVGYGETGGASDSW